MARYHGGMVMRFFLMFAISLLAGACAAHAGFDECVSRLEARAINQGIDQALVGRVVHGQSVDESVLAFLDAQPEFITSPWDYLAGLVDDERIRDGKERLTRNSAVLKKIYELYGVDPAVVVAVWGVESDYGRSMGKRSLAQSLVTLACGPRRQDYFAGELMALLKIMQSGDIQPPDYTGSWAGAFGQTQFMPSVYLAMAVDMDGDGRRDLVHSTADALASTAHYLQAHGWQKDVIWGVEVQLPADYNGPEGRRAKAPLKTWMARGLRLRDGRALSDSKLRGHDVALILPAGAQGPAFLATSNFDAIFSYNASISYALAIAHLADRLRGGGAFVTPWPTEDLGLSRIQRRELQDLLTQRGYDVGASDGVIGAKTREAIAREQSRLGLTPDGHPGILILRALSAH
jgi:lytic murein transglycosylase